MKKSQFQSAVARRVSILAMFAVCGAASAADVYALTVQGNLIRFDTATPGSITTIGGITGAGGAPNAYAGIDFRPATSKLYLVEASTASTLYTVNLGTAQVTFASTMSIGLAGGLYGIDFNPVPDRLRTTSSSGQNLRTNVDTGVVTMDGGLAYGAMDPNAGTTPSIVGSGYTNSLFGSIGGATTLFNIDAATGNLVKQIPPNAGTLETIGALGVVIGSEVGFDIYFNGLSNFAYASVQSPAGGVSNFYSINLSTGAASLIGAVGGGVAIRDFSVIPSPAAAFGLLGGLGLVARRRR